MAFNDTGIYIPFAYDKLTRAFRIKNIIATGSYNAIGGFSGQNIIGYSANSNEFGTNAISNQLGFNSESNQIGNNSYYNNFGNFSTNNFFGRDSTNNYIGYRATLNSIAQNGVTNQFGNLSPFLNAFGSSATYNYFGNDALINNYYSGNAYGQFNFDTRPIVNGSGIKLIGDALISNSFTGLSTQVGTKGEIRSSGGFLYLCTGETAGWVRFLGLTF